METNDKVIIYSESNSICIVHPVPNCGLSFEEIIQRSVPTGLDYSIVNSSDLPKNRLYRDAWIFKDKKISIGLEKSKEIQKNNIRSIRDKLLKEKDIEYMRALESQNNSKVDQIVVEKNKLRDVTNIVDSFIPSSTDPDIVSDELSKVWDSSILGQNTYLNNQ
jgi:hypothetical protein